ncbi:hypothetical protein LI177_04370 [bacterium 210820-DFI.6.37]|nr:hypothetical protein [bacterium 210820-DFI.6.37]
MKKAETGDLFLLFVSESIWLCGLFFFPKAFVYPYKPKPDQFTGLQPLKNRNNRLKTGQCFCF